MVAGAPFPLLLDWTWGELIEFIRCKNEARQSELRMQAAMDFRLANNIIRFLNAKNGQHIKLMDAYPFLWSEEEKKQAQIDEVERMMLARCGNVKKG